ncbi:MAG: hypothetical protein PGN11_18485 [Quadrisphaera sp.]
MQPFGGADLAHRAGQQRVGAEGAQVGGLGGLPHHGVAADQRERGVPGVDGHGEVEGADDADHPERVPRLGEAVARAL